MSRLPPHGAYTSTILESTRQASPLGRSHCYRYEENNTVIVQHLRCLLRARERALINAKTSFVPFFLFEIT